jgi:hypothetical protein
LLYAERLRAHHKPAWIPAGKAREYVELVGAAPRGRPEVA